MIEQEMVVCPFCHQEHMAAPGETPYKGCNCEGAYREREIDKGNALIDVLFDKAHNEAYHSEYDDEIIGLLKYLLSMIYDEEPVSVTYKLSGQDVVTIKKSNGALVVERKKTLKSKK